jgi:hypothetical protein
VHNSGSYFIPLHITESSSVLKGRVLLKAASIILLRERIKDICHSMGKNNRKKERFKMAESLVMVHMHALGSFLHKTERKPSALKGRVSKEAVFLFFYGLPRSCTDT